MLFLVITTLLLCALKTVSAIGMGWYLVGIDSGAPTKCEAHAKFSASVTLSVVPPVGAIALGFDVLVQASSQEDAVRAVFQGTITVTDADGKSHSSTFPSGAFDVGTAAALKLAHSRFSV